MIRGITLTWDIAFTIRQYINSGKLINTETIDAISKASVLEVFAIVKASIKCQSWFETPLTGPERSMAPDRYIRATIGYALNGM